jgi:hypothetical protein
MGGHRLTIPVCDGLRPRAVRQTTTTPCSATPATPSSWQAGRSAPYAPNIQVDARRLWRLEQTWRDLAESSGQDHTDANAGRRAQNTCFCAAVGPQSGRTLGDQIGGSLRGRPKTQVALRNGWPPWAYARLSEFAAAEVIARPVRRLVAHSWRLTLSAAVAGILSAGPACIIMQAGRLHLGAGPGGSSTGAGSRRVRCGPGLAA